MLSLIHISLSESIFGIEPNDHAIYLDVKQFMANQRQGTHKSKERSEISGSTRKLGRQKGGDVYKRQVGYLNTIISKKSLRDIISDVIKAVGVARACTFSANVGPKPET